MLRAITLDYWDTIYLGAALPARGERRRESVRRLLAHYGADLAPAALDTLYKDSGRETGRWWSEEHRGYRAADRIRWMLDRVGIRTAENCEVLSATIREVDYVLLEMPPQLLPGAAEGLRALSARVPLAIISDTGFASGEAQNRLLAQDGLLDCFTATIYSCDVGHTKPRIEMFDAARTALGVPASDILHVGDLERTDIAGALAAGFRAVRIDVARDSGPSAAETVVHSFAKLTAYLLGQH